MDSIRIVIEAASPGAYSKTKYRLGLTSPGIRKITVSIPRDLAERLIKGAQYQLQHFEDVQLSTDIVWELVEDV